MTTQEQELQLFVKGALENTPKNVFRRVTKESHRKELVQWIMAIASKSYEIGLQEDKVNNVEQDDTKK